MADSDCSDSTGKIKLSRQFSYRENEVLQECMETHFKRLTAKHASGGSNPNTKAIQDKVWAKIRDRVNAVGNGPRTIDQIKQRWTNMVKKAKREFTDEKKSLTQTGDGPPLTEMSETSQGIVDMMSGLASFSGIPGASNCESCISAPTSTSVAVEDSHVQIILWEGTPSKTATAVHKGGLPQTPVVKISDEAPAAENCNAGYGSGVDVPAPEPERKKFRPGNISKETPTTLKELQMRYYRKCIEVQEAQLDCWTQCSRLAEVMLQKMA